MGASSQLSFLLPKRLWPVTGWHKTSQHTSPTNYHIFSQCTSHAAQQWVDPGQENTPISKTPMFILSLLFIYAINTTWQIHIQSNGVVWFKGTGGLRWLLLKDLLKQQLRAGEVAQQLRAFAVFLEDSSSIPHTSPSHLPVSPAPGDPAPRIPVLKWLRWRHLVLLFP